MPIPHNREHAGLQYRWLNSPTMDQPWRMNFPRTTDHHNLNHPCSRVKPVSSPVCFNTQKTLYPFIRYSVSLDRNIAILTTSYITTYLCYFSAASFAVSSLLGGLVWETRPFKKSIPFFTVVCSQLVQLPKVAHLRARWVQAQKISDQKTGGGGGSSWHRLI